MSYSERGCSEENLLPCSFDQSLISQYYALHIIQKAPIRTLTKLLEVSISFALIQTLARVLHGSGYNANKAANANT
jgi:hypothetical protein